MPSSYYHLKEYLTCWFLTLWTSFVCFWNVINTESYSIYICTFLCLASYVNTVFVRLICVKHEAVVIHSHTQGPTVCIMDSYNYLSCSWVVELFQVGAIVTMLFWTFTFLILCIFTYKWNGESSTEPWKILLNYLP